MSLIVQLKEGAIVCVAVLRKKEDSKAYKPTLTLTIPILSLIVSYNYWRRKLNCISYLKKV